MTSSRFLRLFLWCAAGLAALVFVTLLAATLALPGWITGRGAELAGQALGRDVRIEQARFQPWRLGLVLEGVRVAGSQPGQPPLLTLARLDVAASLRSLLRGQGVVESLAVDGPVLRLTRLADGHYDIDDLIQRFSKPAAKADGDGPAFAVYNLTFRDGRLLFDDRPVQRQHELAGLQLRLPYLSTLAADVAVKVEPHLSGRFDGVAFDSQAEAQPFAQTPTARLNFKLAGLDLAPLAAYLPGSAPLRWSQGRLDLQLALDFSEPPKQPPSVKLSGQVSLSQMQLTSPDGQALLSWQRLTVPLADVQPLRRRVALGAVRWEAPVATPRPLKFEQSSPSSPAKPTPHAQPWAVSLAGFELVDGKLSWQQLALEAIQLKVGALTWPLTQPTTANASLRWADSTLTGQATMSEQALEVHADLQQLALERLAPWLTLPGSARLAGRLSGQAGLKVDQPLADGADARARLSLSAVDLADLRLSLPGAPKPLLTLARVQLDRADIDPAGHRLQLGHLGLQAPRAQLARNAAGQVNALALLPPASKDAAGGTPWRLQLAGLELSRGSLRWQDAAVPDGAALAVEALNLQLGALSWPQSGPVAARLSAQLAALRADDRVATASGGSLQWQGQLGLAPLSVKGQLKTQGLPLQLFDAYLDPAWGLHLRRAEVGMQADVSARPEGAGWQVQARGDLRVAPLALLQARMVDGSRVIGEDLLSWSALQLSGLQLSLAPGAAPTVVIRNAALDDVYARLIVNEQGRFNLRDVRPADATPVAPVATAATAAPAPAAQVSVERTEVRGGLVDFNDRFIRPNYSARLSELQGTLGAFSSGNPAMAPLTVRGKVAGTGLLEIDGQLNPGGPLAMDLRANATDIELAPLSPYAGKYAGYAIERGKLSTHLQYKIEPGGTLSASNQIVLNQLTFGDKVDSPDATTLPVRFAVSLLKDRDGVIDVNLAVSGSINDPEFSVGGIVWKLILNLIGKALTSPFSLFMGSDSPEAAQIAFAPGTAELPTVDKLDRIARLLTDKPGVQLTLTGWAETASEADTVRELRLAAKLKAENAATPEAALKRLYQATKLPNKPKNIIGLAKDLPPEQMRALLKGNEAVDDETLRQLALARAVAVRDALLARGVPNARVFLAAPKLREACAASCEPGWQPHVEMTLGAH
jgi:uncharacterized protein involved in outer membrane biogenesis